MKLLDTIKGILKECTDIMDVEKLATFDIEYLFLQIRTKSVGESVSATVVCPDDGETEVTVSIPLDEIKVVKDKKHKKEIKLSDDMAVTFDYPRLDTFVKLNFGDGGPSVDTVFEWQHHAWKLLLLKNRYMIVMMLQRMKRLSS